MHVCTISIWKQYAQFVRIYISTNVTRMNEAIGHQVSGSIEDGTDATRRVPEAFNAKINA